MKAYGFISACLACAPALAGEETISLKEGAGRTTVVAQCNTCHSLDYIQMNSPFMDRAGWDKELGKMIDVMGAPITAGDREVMLEYLTRNYGR